MPDRHIEQRIRRALDLALDLDADAIRVVARHGAVTLRGTVRSCAQQDVAARLARRVRGVTTVTNAIDVRVPAGQERPDDDLARAVVRAPSWRAAVPDERVKVVVRHGRVIITGAVDWPFQKDAATRAARSLPGVRGVANHVVVRRAHSPATPLVSGDESVARRAS